MYIVNYYIKDTDRVNAFLTKAKELGKVEVYLPNSALFLDSEKSCDDIYNEFKECVEDADLFFITKLNKREMNGWLSTRSIEWLQNDKNQ